MLPVVILGILFIGFPWVLFHYITKWKTAKTLTSEDENLLDELHDLARRLDDRMLTIERIVQAENPNWRSLGADPVETALEDRSERIFEGTGRTNRPVRRT
ncbi:MAG: phage shock protein [Sphingomonadales bacterium]|jgi:phage shock protein B|nr:phage shock protein [Sphingomonadales bacterium]